MTNGLKITRRALSASVLALALAPRAFAQVNETDRLNAFFEEIYQVGSPGTELEFAL